MYKRQCPRTSSWPGGSAARGLKQLQVPPTTPTGPFQGHNTHQLRECLNLNISLRIHICTIVHTTYAHVGFMNAHGLQQTQQRCFYIYKRFISTLQCEMSIMLEIRTPSCLKSPQIFCLRLVKWSYSRPNN